MIVGIGEFDGDLLTGTAPALEGYGDAVAAEMIADAEEFVDAADLESDMVELGTF